MQLKHLNSIFTKLNGNSGIYMVRDLAKLLLVALITLQGAGVKQVNAKNDIHFIDDDEIDRKKKKKKDSIPIFPDLVYEYKIAELDNLTPIKLDYTPVVRRYIDVYTIERREHLSKILGLAELYFPMFEELLDKYELPYELKYLAVVESALDPTAISSSAAVGLWQFKINSSRMFDLQVDSYVDERRDPYKSTEAACMYLQYLYRIYNDWQLALAAYNGGPGEVKKAIERSGGKTTFWEIQPYLPAQTKGYVPAFIAVMYAMNHAEDHNIEKIPPEFVFMNVDTVHVQGEVGLERIAKTLRLTVEELRFLNPAYKLDVVPKLKDPAILILPKNKIGAYARNEKYLLSENGIKKKSYTELIKEAGDTNGKVKVVHEVSKGEYFHKIAIKYNCTVDDIQIWNSLESYDLGVGQMLEIWVDTALASRIIEEKELAKKQTSTNDRYIYYTVQEGDTIWSIATKFNCPSISQLKMENNIEDETDIKPGTKLKIHLNK